MKNNGNILIPFNFNILLFGLAGAAKSSFINSLVTLISPGFDIITRAAVGGFESHVTTKLTRYMLNGEGTNLTVWDTVGLTHNNYQSGELQGIIKGSFPPNWKFNLREPTKVPSGAHHDQKIHSCIFFLTFEALESLSIVNLMKENCDVLKEFITPIVVITMTDKLDGSIRDNPIQNCDPNIIQRASEILDIPTENIFTPINYVNENRKSFEIDRCNFIILDEVLKITGANFRMLLNGYR